MYALKNVAVLILATWVASSAAIPMPRAGDPVTSGLPADIQAQVDSGKLSCVLNSGGQTACSDQSGASFIVRENTGGGKKNNNGAGAINNGQANAGNQNQAKGQPGDAVTSGLPADIQKKVDKGTLSCVLNSGGQTACSDQSGASFIVDE